MREELRKCRLMCFLSSRCLSGYVQSDFGVKVSKTTCMGETISRRVPPLYKRMIRTTATVTIGSRDERYARKFVPLPIRRNSKHAPGWERFKASIPMLSNKGARAVRLTSFNLPYSDTYTGLHYETVPMFGEFCSCSYSPHMPQLARSILATWEWPYNKALYIIIG